MNSWTARPRTKLFIRSNKGALFWKNKLPPSTLVFDLNAGTWPTCPTLGYIKMILFTTIGGGGRFSLGRLFILYNSNCANYTHESRLRMAQDVYGYNNGRIFILLDYIFFFHLTLLRKEFKGRMVIENNLLMLKAIVNQMVKPEINRLYLTTYL